MHRLRQPLAGIVGVGQDSDFGDFGAELQGAKAGAVERAAQAGVPVAIMAAKAVSIPSATITRVSGTPSRTTPPRQGPSIIFAGLTGAFPEPSAFKKVR